MTRWQRYWFADGGRWAVAIVRIALALSVLGTLAKLSHPLSTGDLPGAHTLYRPVGIWMLLGHAAPPEALVDLLWVIAWGATGMMLVGCCSRAATAASCFAGTALAALSFASSTTWSHQYNVVFLAQVAFLGARCGDALSVDALIRRWRALPPRDVARGYQWSLRLVQLAVALMFSGAVFHKLLHGHFTLRWALTDNLRHHLLVRFDLAGLPRPPLVDWIIDDVWRYRTAAILNMISQAAPIAACIFVTRPWIRALGGLFFVVETIALGLVVGLWNLHWLPLVAVFVDWERLLRRPVAPPAPAGWRPPRARRIFIVAFVAYDALTAFAPGLDQWLNTYPFSGFPMFATIRANPPYDEHQPYAIAADHFVADVAIPDNVQRWLDHANRGIETTTDPVKLQKRLVAVLGQVQRRYPDAHLHGLTLWLTLFEAPAYPAPAHFEPHPIAVLAEIRDDGTYRSVLGTLADGQATLARRGVEGQEVQLAYYRDDAPAPIPLQATREGDRFAIGELEGNPIYVVATIAGTPWLVATAKHWVWN